MMKKEIKIIPELEKCNLTPTSVRLKSQHTREKNRPSPERFQFSPYKNKTDTCYEGCFHQVGVLELLAVFVGS